MGVAQESRIRSLARWVPPLTMEEAERGGIPTRGLGQATASSVVSVHVMHLGTAEARGPRAALPPREKTRHNVTTHV